jgi:hypothetical protein
MQAKMKLMTLWEENCEQKKDKLQPIEKPEVIPIYMKTLEIITEGL